MVNKYLVCQKFETIKFYEIYAEDEDQASQYLEQFSDIIEPVSVQEEYVSEEVFFEERAPIQEL